MKKAAAARLLTYLVLILTVSGIYAYNITGKNAGGNEVCRLKKAKEQDDIKLKTSVPLWQSLSRQLITTGR